MRHPMSTTHTSKIDIQQATPIELLAKVEPLPKYLMVCAYTGRVPFADEQTAELLTKIRKAINTPFSAPLKPAADPPTTSAPPAPPSPTDPQD